MPFTIDDPSVYFQTLIYSGNSTDDRDLTNTGNSNLQPDWLWIKERTDTSSHQLINTTLGIRYANFTDKNDALDDDQNRVQAVSSDGFQVGTASTVNANGDDYVAWQWKANGGTTSTNSDGTIDTTIQASAISGFSIIKWTGTGSNATIGHGLGKKPGFYALKRTGAAEGWSCYVDGLDAGAGKILSFASTSAASSSSGDFNDTEPTSSVISVGTQDRTNSNGQEHIGYVFTPIQGFSAMGQYDGNGNSDGTFVHTGFKVGWLLIKSLEGTTDWRMFDNKRDSTNVVKGRLFPNTTDTENTSQDTLDFLSNGFKIRTTNSGSNGNNNAYFYLAFAETPFVTSTGVPTTAV